MPVAVEYRVKVTWADGTVEDYVGNQLPGPEAADRLEILADEIRQATQAEIAREVRA
jgi:hypothetical protein